MSCKSSVPGEEVLQQLEVGREGATRIMAGPKPFLGKYNRARELVAAIDALVESLTGDRERFWTKPHGWVLACKVRFADTAARPP